MPKLRLIGLTLLALSATAVSHAEEKRYVSDELNTWVRSGPGDNYRLVGTVNAGEEVTLLQTDANTNYAQVKDSTGRTAWIPLKELNSTPSLRTRVPDLENQVKILTDKLNNIDTTWNQRTADMQQKPTRAPIPLEAKNGLKNDTYTIAMARTGIPDSATAQFFINVKDNAMLNAPNPDGHGYAVFGKVVSGTEVVDKIKAVATGNKGGHQNVPTTPVTIQSATLVK